MPDVRMNYDSMDRMEQAFKQAHQQILNTMAQMTKVSKTLEDGALHGLAGDSFRDAINTKLHKRLQVIADKMHELEGDIHGAVIATRDGVKTAQSRFK